MLFKFTRRVHVSGYMHEKGRIYNDVSPSDALNLEKVKYGQRVAETSTAAPAAVSTEEVHATEAPSSLVGGHVLTGVEPGIVAGAIQPPPPSTEDDDSESSAGGTGPDDPELGSDDPEPGPFHCPNGGCKFRRGGKTLKSEAALEAHREKTGH